MNISASFSDVPYSLITLVNNIPNLCAVIFTLVAGALVNRKVTLKNMILIGTGLHCVGGIMPAFTGSSFALLMLGRFAFGIGYGIMQGICISMSFKLVTNEKLRAAAMGWALTAQYATNMVAQVVVGYLCERGWNYSFLIYAWSIIPFLVVLFLCPKFKLDKDDRTALGGEGSSLGQSETLWQSLKAMPKSVWIFSVIVGAYMFCYYPMFLTIGQIIIGRNFGTSVSVGYAMTFYSVSSLLGGLFFGFIAKYLKHWTCCLALIGVALRNVHRLADVEADAGVLSAELADKVCVRGAHVDLGRIARLLAARDKAVAALVVRVYCYELLVPQLGNVDGPAARERIFARDEEIYRLALGGVDGKDVRVHRHGAEGHVRLAADQGVFALDVGRLLEVQVYLRIAVPEAAEGVEGKDVHHAGGEIDVERGDVLLPHLGQLLRDAVVLTQDADRAVEKELAVVGELQLHVLPHKEGHVQLLLHAAYYLAYALLSYEQLVCSLGKAHVTADRDVALELIHIQAPTP